MLALSLIGPSAGYAGPGRRAEETGIFVLPALDSDALLSLEVQLFFRYSARIARMIDVGLCDNCNGFGKL